MHQEQEQASPLPVVRVSLSDEDIEKLADAIVTKSTQQFQLNVGKAVLDYLWKTAVAAAIVLYFAFKK